MTTTQLDKLRRIDAHLANLLATAEKRTRGEWQAATETVWTRHERICGDAETDDCAFIASCAGNAEAGWWATRATIDWLFTMQKHGGSQEIPRLSGLAEDILAAFPLESLKP